MSEVGSVTSNNDHTPRLPPQTFDITLHWPESPFPPSEPARSHQPAPANPRERPRIRRRHRRPDRWGSPGGADRRNRRRQSARQTRIIERPQIQAVNPAGGVEDEHVIRTDRLRPPTIARTMAWEREADHGVLPDGDDLDRLDDLVLGLLRPLPTPDAFTPHLMVKNRLRARSPYICAAPRPKYPKSKGDE